MLASGTRDSCSINRETPQEQSDGNNTGLDYLKIESSRRNLDKDNKRVLFGAE